MGRTVLGSRREDVRFGALAFLYIMAVAIASGVVSAYGPAALPYTALFLIGLDLTTRDFLHEYLTDRAVRPLLFMMLIITAGGMVNLATATGGRQIVVASTAAFLLGGYVDMLVYHWLSSQTVAVRVLGSNLASALVDSTVFPLLAFSMLSMPLLAQQTALKVIGGAVWLLILRKR